MGLTPSLNQCSLLAQMILDNDKLCCKPGVDFDAVTTVVEKTPTRKYKWLLHLIYAHKIDDLVTELQALGLHVVKK